MNNTEILWDHLIVTFKEEKYLSWCLRALTVKYVAF